MKKNYLILAILFLFGSISYVNARSYPVKQVTGNYCEQTGAACTIDLPRIVGADYLAYQNSPRYRSIYSVMWGGTYYNGRDFGFGSHQGVDITSTLGTPITAMGDGEVVEAEEKGEWGNTIVIKHTVGGSTLWSVYAHLNEMLVKVGDEVREGDLIGRMGKTGNTTGIHVHFQIDTEDGKHPYFPKGCEGTITEIVNEGRCWDQIKSHTLDPILFLETNGAIYKAERSIETTVRESDYVSAYNLKYQLGTSVIKQDTTTSLLITPKEEGKDVFLKDDLSILATTGLYIASSKVSYVGTGRDVLIAGITEGLHKLTIKSGNSTIKKYNIFVLSEDMIAMLREKFSTNKAIQDILDNL